MTGAPLPRGADAVVMVEDTDFNDREAGKAAPENVTVFKPSKPGKMSGPAAWISKAATRSCLRASDCAPQDMGLLAMLGVAQVHVYRKPLVALLSSGDELTRSTDRSSREKSGIQIHIPLQL